MQTPPNDSRMASDAGELNAAVAAVLGVDGFTYWFVEGEQPNIQKAYMCREAAEAAASKQGKSGVVPVVEHRMYSTDMNECLWAVERAITRCAEAGHPGVLFDLQRKVGEDTSRWMATFAHPEHHYHAHGEGAYAGIAICRAIVALPSTTLIPHP